MKKTILLPLDGSENALKAVLPAKSLAVLLNAYIHIIHISDEILSQEELIKKLKIIPDALQEFVLDQKTGDPAQVILEESKSADYIVLLTYTKDHDKKDIIGSVTQKILKSSSIPILLIRPDVNIVKEDRIWKPRKILMPLDGTPESAHALEVCINMINKIKPEIDVLHIFSPLEKEQGGDSLTAPYYEDSPHQEWPVWSKEFLKRFSSPVLKGIITNLFLSRGDPAVSIINFSKDKKTDLIISGWKGILSGHHANTLKKIIQEVACPILLIKITVEQENPEQIPMGNAINTLSDFNQ